MNRRILLGVWLCALTACRVPDLKPFSDATAEMATLLKKGFEQSETALAGAAETADDTEAFNDKVKELRKVWTPTRQALSSLVDYSDSLSALAESGAKGKETMARLTGTINELASAVGALPAASAANLVQAVGGKIIEMQAAGDIRKAVGKAGEAVDIIAPILKQNFVDLRNLHAAAARAWEARVQEQSSILVNYYESLAKEEERLHYLLNLIMDYQSAPHRLRWRASLARANGKDSEAKKFEDSVPIEQKDNLRRLQESDSAFSELDLSSPGMIAEKVEGRQRHLMELLSAHRKEMNLLEPKYQQAVSDMDAVHKTRVTGDQILGKGAEAIDAWQKSHKSLQAAAEKKQSRPTVAELLSIVDELSALQK